MQQLTPSPPVLDDAALAALYDEGSGAGNFVRLNMVATVDGSAHGPNGLSGTINTGADHRVFAMLRAWADVILVGSGTVTAEGYRSPEPDPQWSFLRDGRDPAPALAILTSCGQVPAGVVQPGGGAVFAVHSTADAGLAPALGQVHDRGLHRVLCEGGPTIAGELLAQGLVDELCLTIAPRVVVGRAGRIAVGEQVLTDWRLTGVLEQDSTLITRWRPA